MCTDEQHNQKMQALARIEKHLHTVIGGRTPINRTESISDSQGLILDYKNRKHIYIFSVNPLTLNLGSLGNLPVSQGKWQNLDFSEGFKVFTVGQASTVNVEVRCTDEVIA